uniref:Breast cancer metastasis-suppressor 1-like protein n=1 Tax=Dermatophagoides pteronyssinus TaxID=6956 RepID=A0A6P6Y0U8_DERPT|nr:breast cancer metastasis-suppressor 1-like protein [Dermatophagoides pteronyssinus]
MSSMENENNGDNDEMVDIDKDDSNDDSSSSSSSSDEFESSDFECEDKDEKYNNIVIDIEKQFYLIQKLYKNEKNFEIDSKIQQILDGIAPEYLQPYEELISQNRIRIEIAELIRNFRLNNLNQFYDAEKLAAEQNYKNEKELLKDSIRKDVEEKIQKLNEERYKADSEFFSVSINYMKKSRKYSYNDDYNNNNNNSGVGGGGTSGHNEKRRKAIPISGPYIIHRLKEDEIKEDVNFIKCCLRSQKNNYSMHHNNHNHHHHQYLHHF